MADASAPSTAPARIRRALTSRCPATPCLARALSSGCLRRDDAAASVRVCSRQCAGSRRVRPAAARTVRAPARARSAYSLSPTGGRAAFSAALVGDDRVALEVRHGRLIARPHPSIRGMIEARGLGLLRVAYEPACVLRAVVDLLASGKSPKRYPDEDGSNNSVERRDAAAYVRKRRRRRGGGASCGLHSERCDKLTGVCCFRLPISPRCTKCRPC